LMPPSSANLILAQQITSTLVSTECPTANARRVPAVDIGDP